MKIQNSIIFLIWRGWIFKNLLQIGSCEWDEKKKLKIEIDVDKSSHSSLSMMDKLDDENGAEEKKAINF